MAERVDGGPERVAEPAGGRRQPGGVRDIPGAREAGHSPGDEAGRGNDQQQQVRAPYRPSGGAVDNTPQHASHSVRRHAPGTGPEDGQPRDLWPPGLTEYAHRDEAGVVAGV